MDEQTTIAPLPADLNEWDSERLKAAYEQRKTRLKALFAEIGDDLSTATAAQAHEAKQLDADVKRLEQPVNPMIHYQPRPTGSSTSTSKRWKPEASSLLTGLGAEFVKSYSKALNGTAGGGSLAVPFFDPGLYELRQRQLFVRSLIPTTRISTDSVSYVQQTVFTNNAAPVTAGSAKPTSVLTYARKTAPVRVIAHVSEALDRMILEDYDTLTRFIDSQLRLGVLLAEEDAILNGSGAPGLDGILNDSNIQTQAKGTDPTPDAIEKAITSKACRVCRTGRGRYAPERLDATRDTDDRGRDLHLGLARRGDTADRVGTQGDHLARDDRKHGAGRRVRRRLRSVRTGRSPRNVRRNRAQRLRCRTVHTQPSEIQG